MDLRTMKLAVTRIECSRLWHVLLVTNLVGIIPASRAQEDFIRPFPLSQIELHHGSQFDKAFELNKEYMQSLPLDRLLHTFRLNAGLNSTAKPFTGSWEDPTCEVRGQFMGHYLSGGAMLVNHTGQTLPAFDALARCLGSSSGPLCSTMPK